jgi:hypothetical protein
MSDFERGGGFASAFGVRPGIAGHYSEMDVLAYRFDVMAGILINMSFSVFLVPVMLALMATTALTYMRKTPFLNLMYSDHFPTWILQTSVSNIQPMVPLICGPNDYIHDEAMFGQQSVTCAPFISL